MKNNTFFAKLHQFEEKNKTYVDIYTKGTDGTNFWWSTIHIDFFYECKNSYSENAEMVNKLKNGEEIEFEIKNVI